MIPHPHIRDERTMKAGPWCLYLARHDGHGARMEATEFDTGFMQLRQARAGGDGWNVWVIHKTDFFMCYRDEPEHVLGSVAGESTTPFTTRDARRWAHGHTL